VTGELAVNMPGRSSINGGSGKVHNHLDGSPWKLNWGNGITQIQFPRKFPRRPPISKGSCNKVARRYFNISGLRMRLVKELEKIDARKLCSQYF